MGSLKLQSFEDFAIASKIEQSAKIEEEQITARETAAESFKSLLSEFGVTSIKELNEEDRTKFFSKLGASSVTESLAIIEEGTRCQIGKIKKNGKIESVYMHYDGYPDNMLPIIKKGYSDGKAVDTLLKKGGGSGLAVKIEDINFYNDKTPNSTGDMKNVEKFVKDAANNGGAEFIYLYSEKDSKWYMVDVYDSYELDAAFESTIINETFKPSKGNLRDAKKVAKFLESFFMKHPALVENNGLMLGVCKYMLAEALTDANFHRYRDPVSKVLKGKITTIMVDIENLGGMQVPVGKKSILNLLETQTSGLANAAGWSGIGIVEGMALFLDGFGLTDPAQKIVDAFELIWANESVMNEGNAFLAARAKAIEEDAEEFEFNGKNFPVINNSVEVEESVVTESGPKCSNKKGHLWKEIDKDGTVECEYCGLRNSLSEGKLTESEKDLKVGDTGIDYNDNVVEVIEIGKFDKVAKSFKKQMKADAEDYGYEKSAGDFYLTKTIEATEGNVGDLAIYPVKYDMSNYWGLTAESVVNEAEVTSDEDFKEYAFAVLQKAFGEDFDEAKAQEVVDGLLSKHGDEYGAAVGALTSSLG